MSMILVPTLPVAAVRKRAAGLHGKAGAAFSAFLLGLPLWWVLGTGFMMPMLLALILFMIRPAANLHFSLSDSLLAAIIVALTGSAFVNGLIIADEPLRFAAAIYNAAIWASALIVAQQFRAALGHSAASHRRILRHAFWSLAILLAVAWGCFAMAYALRSFDWQFPSLFGALAGNNIPDSAALIRQSSIISLTKADWGLPGVPMPRVGIYAPYPNATAITIAVLGTLALLYVHMSRKRPAIPALLLEGLLTLTLAITLSRSVLAGWLAGMLVAGLAFGSPLRRLASAAAVATALLLPIFVDVTSIAAYRQYSTESRTDNYVRAVAETLNSNPLFGLGIKPREEISHIAVGSHSTFISAFTKGGVVGLSLAAAYLLVLPAARWLGLLVRSPGLPSSALTQLRLLLTLQMTLWAWLIFEDIDAPAIASMLIFMFIAYFEFLAGRLRSAGAAPPPTPLRQSSGS